jgi:D-ala-D-ala dipeptidase
MLIRTGLLLIVMLLPAPALAGSALPGGFVYLRDVDPTIVQDIRYAGSHNFVGRPIRGYRAAECILGLPAAKALATVQRKLAGMKLSLIVWDCYRPKRAVEDFLQWSRDPAHAEMKAEFYPRTSESCSRSAIWPRDRRIRAEARWTSGSSRIPFRLRRHRIPCCRSSHARRQRVNDSRMEPSILEPAMIVWMCSQPRQTPQSAGSRCKTAIC